MQKMRAKHKKSISFVVIDSFLLLFINLPNRYAQFLGPLSINTISATEKAIGALRKAILETKAYV